MCGDQNCQPTPNQIGCTGSWALRSPWRGASAEVGPQRALNFKRVARVRSDLLSQFTSASRLRFANTWAPQDFKVWGSYALKNQVHTWFRERGGIVAKRQYDLFAVSDSLMCDTCVLKTVAKSDHHPVGALCRMTPTMERTLRSEDFRWQRSLKGWQPQDQEAFNRYRQNAALLWDTRATSTSLTSSAGLALMEICFLEAAASPGCLSKSQISKAAATANPQPKLLYARMKMATSEEARALAKQEWKLECRRNRRNRCTARLRTSAKNAAKTITLGAWKKPDGSLAWTSEEQKTEIQKQCSERFTDSSETESTIAARSAQIESWIADLHPKSRGFPISLADSMCAIATNNSNSAGGNDRLVAELIKSASWLCKYCLNFMWNARLHSETYPLDPNHWKYILLYGLPKSKIPESLDDVRLIALVNVMQKSFVAAAPQAELRNRPTTAANSLLNQDSVLNFGFQLGVPSCAVAFTLSMLLKRASRWAHLPHIYVLSCDILQAFDHILHKHLFAALQSEGSSPLLTRCIIGEWKGLTAKALVGQIETEKFPYTRGGGQGRRESLGFGALCFRTPCEI